MRNYRCFEKEIYRFISRYPGIAGCCYSTFQFLIVFLLGRPAWEGADDFTIAHLLAGTSGEATPYVVVMNYYLCSFLVALYEYFPFINWLPLVEAFSIWAVFWVFDFILFKNAKKEAVRFILFFSLIFEMESFLKLTYTRSACLLSFAGLLLLYDGIFAEPIDENDKTDDLSKVTISERKSQTILKILISYVVFIMGALIHLRTGKLSIISFIGVLLLWKNIFGTYELKNRGWHISQSFLRGTQMVAGDILFLLGMMFRFDCIYLAIAYVGILIVSHIIHCWFKNRSIIKYRKKYIQLLMTICCLFIATLLFKIGNERKYFEFDKNSDYRSFNKARADVVDYLPNEYTDKLSSEKLKVSENDYLMIGGFYNDPYFDKEFFQNVKENLNRVKEETKTSFTESIKKTVNRILYNSQGKYRRQRTLAVVWIFFVFAGIIGANRKCILPIIFDIAGTITIIIFFTWNGRFPPWVSDSVYLMSCFIICLEISRNISQTDIRTKWDYFRKHTVLAILIACAVFRLDSFNKELKSYHYDASLAELFSYVVKSDEIYLIDNFSNVPYPIIDVKGIFEPLHKGEWNNIIRVGNWDVRHPVKNLQLQQLNINSPISDIINPNVRLISLLNSYSLNVYVQFFKEHYDMDIEYKEEKIFGNYAIFVFSPKQQIS